MTTIIDDVFNNIEVLQTEKHENMTVIGLNIPENNVDLMSLEIGLDMGLVEITELDEEGSVNQVKVINKAVTPLLLLDGEEIVGSKQNRIVNATIIIPPESEKIIPVSCVEQGRWNYKTTKFHYSNHMATSRVRRNKLSSVNKSLREENDFKSNQGEVWNNVNETLNSLDVSSSTSALHDSYNQRGTMINEYLDDFSLNEKQNGILVYINGKLSGFEIIYNKARYREYHKKLLESYVMDAIVKQDEEVVDDKISPDEIITKIMSSPREKYESVGLGEDYRVEDDDIMGSMVIYDDKLVNASFFIKDDA